MFYLSKKKKKRQLRHFDVKIGFFFLFVLFVYLNFSDRMLILCKGHIY